MRANDIGIVEPVTNPSHGSSIRQALGDLVFGNTRVWRVPDLPIDSNQGILDSAPSFGRRALTPPPSGTTLEAGSTLDSR